MTRKIVIISTFLFLITIYGLRFTGYEIYAQHEGHQPGGSGLAKEETKTKVKKPVSKKAIYYCPMHPSYISDKPGDCPICNMKLVKKEEAQAVEKEAGASEGAGEGFYVSLEKQQLIGVKTDKVIYRPLSKIIRTVGRVAFDPELYKAQQEYIEALKTKESVKESGQETVIKRAEALVEAAKLKLKLQGLDITQIEELQETKENDQSLLISSLESDSTWVYATIYEYELEWIKLGQEAVVIAASYPGKEFKGTIVAIDPVFNAMTRSVRARIKVDNQDSLLKPDMYVDVQMSSDLGAHLSVPKEAILDSGLRKIVFLSLNDGHFKPVELKTGISTEEYIQVLEGLKEGDTVVISGNFLIDSESKLKSALEGAGHQHGQ
ncbi:MAG: efflux RND transporter periplasmic adaptor subunit [Candidatus Omnitrophica bacterium]|nr:efflux RND transporter periplasmic adaptor subunit [Candidatus Omnitrophota bacterium]MDD5553203.1 efflux RND transporter periplasmic adaptor subunit [Candidatus Omnitrophota bacterium]